jgi:transposase
MDDYRALEARILSLDREIEHLARTNEVAKRLTTIPGVGPLGATPLIVAVGDGRQFKRARDLAAWLGLVPRQNSTGGRVVLLGISKRGNPYIRKLLIHGARSCLLHLDRDQHALGRWLNRLVQRVHRNKAVIALANKIARMAWAV